MTMHSSTSEDVQVYVIQLTFFMGGIFVIANTAAIMCRTVFKLFSPSSKKSKLEEYEVLECHLSKKKDYNSFNSTIQTSTNIDGLRNRKAPFSTKNAIGNDNICTTIDDRIQTSGNGKTYNLKLLKLLFFCCMFENMCIITNGAFTDDVTFHEFSKNCSSPSNINDCVIFNAIIILKKKHFSSFFCTLGLTALSVFPVIVYVTKHCFKGYFQGLVGSTIILFFVLVSRCFAFLFFPHFILQATRHSCTLERLLSSWVAFLSMALGVKLTIETSSKNRENVKVSKSHADLTDEMCGHVEKMTETDFNSAKLIKKNNIVMRGTKRHHRRQQSDMVFGSDAFVPCVVLMKKPNTNFYKQNFNIGTLSRPARTRRRASLDVIKEHQGMNEISKLSELIHRRRTSLPTILASSKRKAVMSSVLIDTTTLAEVHSTLEELSKKPSNFTDFVKKLQNLLKPYKSDHVKPRQVVWLHDGAAEASDEEALCVSPRHGTNKRSMQRRSDWQIGQRDLFSTTTTATGLPKEEPGPVKPKRLPTIPKEKTPLGSPYDSRCASPVIDSLSPLNMGRRRTYPNIPVSHASKFFSTSPYNTVPKKVSIISSDYESCDNDDVLAIQHPTTVRSKSVTDRADRSSSHNCITDNPPAPTIIHRDFTPIRTVVTPPAVDDSLIVVEEGGRPCSQWNGDQQTDDGHMLFNKYQEELLESVYNWNFQIFELAEKTSCVLSQMAFKLFQDTGLFDTFNIPKREFVCYMNALENGYRGIPYHNRIHAADVLHGCWFLSTQEIPGFHDHSPLFSSDSSDSDSGTSTTNARQVNNIGHGSLAQAIPALELMSLYLAAAMHDYDHPGRTNAFLVETRHPLAILYNDRSVLENHHAAASWELLYSNENFNFLRNLDTAEWKRLRFLIVEAILATDLKKHFDILSQFSAKSKPTSLPASSEEGGEPCKKTGINWSADEDRLLVCQMVIKLADIGGPAKLKPLHITWTKAICEEFFIQGDEERELAVPVSPFMNREKPQVAELQRTFITKLIKPIVQSMHKTGILAGEIPEDSEAFAESVGSSEGNLLLEQLNENLNFWTIPTSSSGHVEMREAFKLALTIHLSEPSSADLVSNDVIVLNKIEKKELYNDVTDKPANDNVFDGEPPQTICLSNDVSMTSSISPTDRGRSKSKLQRPKIIVNKQMLRHHSPIHGSHLALPACQIRHDDKKGGKIQCNK